MKFATSLFLLASTAGLAAAQPADEGGPPPPAPPAPPPPAPAPIPPTALPVAHGEHAYDEGEHQIPHEFTIGIGIGYDLPTSLEVPNATSVRFRLRNGITFEPFVTLANTAQKVDTGMSETQNTTEFGVGAAVAFPIMHRRKVELEVIGRLSVDQSIQDPPGDMNSTTLTTLALGYGLAVNYWFTPHWDLSLTAANPILAVDKTKQEEGPATTIDTTTTVGLIWNPTVALMVHLYL